MASASLTGIEQELRWISPPHGWFMAEAFLQNREVVTVIAEDGTQDASQLSQDPGFSKVAFLVCDICVRLGKFEMPIAN